MHTSFELINDIIAVCYQHEIDSSVLNTRYVMEFLLSADQVNAKLKKKLGYIKN